jgi:spore maturation protein CgeB
LKRRAYVLYPSTSLYSVLHYFSDKLHEALCRGGIESRILHGEDRYKVVESNPPDFTICFNGAATLEDDRFLCDYVQVPHVSWLVDPFFRFYNLMNSSQMIIACDDRVSCSTMQGLGFRRSLFLPHAVERDLDYDSSKERIYDVVMLATYIDSEALRKKWKRRFPKKILTAMDETIENVLANPNVSFIQTLMQALYPFWQGDKNRLFDLFNQEIFSEVELYLKGKDRLDLIHALKDDHTIHLFGGSFNSERGWENCFDQKKQVVVHSALSYIEALEVMKQSKIVLNSCIKNVYGAHERIFAALACGAVSVTNDNPFMKEHFLSGKEIILYNRSDFAKTSKAVAELLSDEEKRRQMAARGRSTVMAEHTWDNRVAVLLEAISPFLK